MPPTIGAAMGFITSEPTPDYWRAAEEFLAGFEPKKSRTEGIPRAVSA